MIELIQTIQFRIEELNIELSKTKCPRKKFFIQNTINTNLKILLAINPKGTCH